MAAVVMARARHGNKRQRYDYCNHVLSRNRYAANGEIVERERGVSMVQWGENLLSVVTDRPAIGWAEKAHAFESGPAEGSTTKQWHTAHADKAVAERKRRAITEPALAREAHKNKFKRDMAVVTAVVKGELTDGLLSACKDLVHEQQVRACVHT
jgi:hypothetical protein